MGNTTMQKAHETYETNLAQIQKKLYIQAFIQYEDLKNQQATLCTKATIRGTLVQKKHHRNIAGKDHCYIYYYLQVSECTDGKRKTKRHYVPKENLAQVKVKLQEQENQKKNAQAMRVVLQEKAGLLKEHEKQLQKYIRKGLLPDMEMLTQEARQKYAVYQQAKAYRQQQVTSAYGTPTYKIMTEAGELVISKNECIVANMLYHKNILYFYEKPLRLKPKRDGTPVVLHPDFTIQVGNREIYIEILGMMTKEEYATSWEYRLATYKINGIRLGKNLVALEFPDTEQGQKVDCTKVSHIIDAVLKDRLPQDVVRCGMTI